VVECERGWRAERAYPFELKVEELAQRYGCSTLNREIEDLTRSAT